MKQSDTAPSFRLVRCRFVCLLIQFVCLFCNRKHKNELNYDHKHKCNAEIFTGAQASDHNHEHSNKHYVFIPELCAFVCADISHPHQNCYHWDYAPKRRQDSFKCSSVHHTAELNYKSCHRHQPEPQCCRGCLPILRHVFTPPKSSFVYKLWFPTGMQGIC